MSSSHLGRTFLLTALLATAFSLEPYAQEPAEPEMSTTEAPFTLKVERNEVPVRVVVRDRDGRPVRNLTKEDFQVLDNGKPQVITQFSIENATTPATPVEKPAAEAKPPAPPIIADRFVALYFDDLTMDFEAITRSRDAASKFLRTSVGPGDRAAIYTSSGQHNQDFTSDPDKLQEALSHLRPVGIFGTSGRDCPDLSDYEAYQIDELHDGMALAVATYKVIKCLCHGGACPDAQDLAKAAARQRWATAQTQATYSLRGLDDLVKRLSVLPGQRSVVFVSRGFMPQAQLRLISEIVDRAVHAGIVVNGLDPRGLYPLSTDADATTPGPQVPTQLMSVWMSIEISAAQEDGAVLAEITDGTGGFFFHNNNDFDEGFRRVGGLSEFSYVLVFSPSDLKPDGKYHQLKISLTGNAKDSKFTLQARRGYFAAITLQDVPRKVEAELTTAMYSRDETNRSRIRIGTRFFKPTPTEAQVTIVAHLDTQGLAFRTVNGRHTTDLTFATVIFDNDGNFVQGLRKSLVLHLRDKTLERVHAAGVSVTSDFKIPPGTYLVREIVRDGDGMISTVNNTLEIPY